MGCVAERLEARVRLLDADGEDADLLDLPLVVAHVVATLELVGEEVVARVVEVRQREVALEEARRGGGLVLGAREAAVGAHLGELVRRVGLGEVLLQDVAADEVVVIGERVPLVDVACEEVGDPHALAAERLGPRRPVRGAEERVAARAPDLAVDLHRELLPVLTDAEVLGVRAFHLREAESEVLLQIGLLRLGQLGCAEGVHRGRQPEHHRHRRPEPQRARGPSAPRGSSHGALPLAHIDAKENHQDA